MVEPTVWAMPDGPDATNALLQADARAFPTFSRGPAFHGAQVPSGQTWAIPSVAQLPFEAAPPAHLQASVGLVTPVAPGRFESGVRVIADLPLHLMAATAAQELHLELHADHRQLCLRATDARGAPRLAPPGPHDCAGSKHVHGRRPKQCWNGRHVGGPVESGQLPNDRGLLGVVPGRWPRVRDRCCAPDGRG